MENSRLFDRARAPDPADAFYALVSGEQPDRRGAPARAAWEIECLATARGWPAGETLGCEAWLRERLQVSRETLREAIRIVESRGAMKMRRGRLGGLVLLRPPVERTAASLAAYLKATGFTREDFARSLRGLDQLIAWRLARRSGPLPQRQPGETVRRWLVRASGRQTYEICLSALEALTPSDALDASQPLPADLHRGLARRDHRQIFDLLCGLPFALCRAPAECEERGAPVRAGAIAVAIVENAGGCCADLGNEASLCERFNASRPLMRQALRILQDLDMVHVRLGRGGGYALKQPSPIGIIRQMFVWLAARNCDPFALNELVWDLNAVNVRLAGERLAAMPTGERTWHCDRIERLLGEWDRAERFVRLQQELAQLAGCPMVDALARCIVSYQARTYHDASLRPVSSELEAMLLLVIAALRHADLDSAERTLRVLQNDTERLLLASVRRCETVPAAAPAGSRAALLA